MSLEQKQFWAVFCADGGKTDGVLYSEKKKAQSTRDFADKQSKSCGPHVLKTLEIVEEKDVSDSLSEQP